MVNWADPEGIAAVNTPGAHYIDGDGEEWVVGEGGTDHPAGRNPDEALDFGPRPERRLDFLILTMPAKEIVSVSFREGIDFIDEDWPEFGNFLILATA